TANATIVAPTSNAIHRRTCRLQSRAASPLRAVTLRRACAGCNQTRPRLTGSRCRYRPACGGWRMQALIVSVVLLGLAVAVSSPTSVLAVLVILEMTSGVRRGVAFV